MMTQARRYPVPGLILCGFPFGVGKMLPFSPPASAVVTTVLEAGSLPHSITILGESSLRHWIIRPKCGLDTILADLSRILVFAFA